VNRKINEAIKKYNI